METVTIGDVWGEQFHADPLHEVVHVLEGQAEIRFERRSYGVRSGDTFIIPQGVRHRDMRGPGAPYRVLYVFFQWPEAGRAFHRMDLRLLLDLPGEPKAHLRRTMLALGDSLATEDAGLPARLSLLLAETLLSAVRYTMPRSRPVPDVARRLAGSRRRRLAEEVSEYLRAHYAETIALDVLARRFSVSPFHLSRVFNRAFGQSISDTLSLLRMDRARELLREGDRSVKEVAAQIGYADAHYFAKVFRRACGRTPSEYRLDARKKESIRP